ncbi:MAG: (deoxy)nucleoside triphosphate pyrophosphohydrolase [Alphaproteobacteria bacterium]|nr:(deoxy)nucleoside triphosphate pyrophosphohydrolase [Alphaproteobacteria bacterium]NDC56759.1 (deoxy)nucleoside triphosphate pyrophosphohydrolase [Alphaproteobacteria bacterium]NDG04031.1 (deoxy)nucleoside triphosphate pyrophosphohydrolase [Alphaproteobacteria bacterium]
MLALHKPPRDVLLVVGAVMQDADGRVLIAERPAGKPMAGLWEFPGGKVGAGETPEAALVRELKEELGIETCVGCVWPLCFASHAYEHFHVLMPLFRLQKWEGQVMPREGQKLAWVHPRDFSQYTFLPADVAVLPVIQQLL